MWGDLEDFIGEKVPELVDELETFYRLPASSEEIEEFELKRDINFPEYLTETFEEYNGLNDFPPYFPCVILGLDEIAKVIEDMEGANVVDSEMEEYDWSPSWIPFAAYGNGDLACIDLGYKPEDDDEEGWDGLPEGFEGTGYIFMYRSEDNMVEVVFHDIEDWVESLCEEIEIAYKKAH